MFFFARFEWFVFTQQDQNSDAVLKVRVIYKTRCRRKEICD